MPPATIKSVYARVLREIEANPALAENVCIEVFLTTAEEESNPISYEEDRNEMQAFTYHMPRGNGGEIGTIFYRGNDRTHGHSFYFVPTPRLKDLQGAQLLEIAKKLERESGLVKKIKVLFNPEEHVVIDPRSNTEIENERKKNRASKRIRDKFDISWSYEQLSKKRLAEEYEKAEEEKEKNLEMREIDRDEESSMQTRKRNMSIDGIIV